ncbi:MAG: 50S ribosomal protein L29 [Planctomycetota bacterium]|nr:50S ribosomal protein L29 [Planctomycetota bacterium]
MKIEELRGKSSEDLLDLIEECKEKLFKLRFAAVTDKVDNPSEIRKLRKTVARVKTILGQRESAPAEATAGADE